MPQTQEILGDDEILDPNDDLLDSEEEEEVEDAEDDEDAGIVEDLLGGLSPSPGFISGSAPSMVSQITPARSIASAREVRERAVAAVIETDEEFQEFLQAFDDTNKSHKISIHRRQPLKYKGHEIEGFLDDYTRPVSLSEMKEEYGGGTYEVYVNGRLSPDSNKRGTKARVTVKISGVPKLQFEEQNGGEGWAKDLVKNTLEAAEREKEALRESMRELKEEALASAAKMEERMMKFVEAQQAAGKMSPDEIRLQLEREKAEREERAAERALEREERIRREEKAAERDRQHQKEMAEFQAKMMQMQAETRAQAAAAQQAAQESTNKLMQAMMNNKGDDKMLAFMQSSMEARMAQADAQQKFLLQAQQQTSQTQLEQVLSLQSAKDTFFANALKSQNKNSGIGDIIALATQFKELNGLFGGGDEDQPLAKQILEGAKDLIPALGGAASAFRGGTPALPQPPPAPALGPGAVAEVDLPPEEVPQPPRNPRTNSLVGMTPEQRREARAKRRAARAKLEKLYGTGEEPPATPAPPAAPEPEVLAPAPPQPTAESPPTVGEEFMPRPTDRVLEVAEEFQMLGYNVEVALRKEMDAETFYENHVDLSAPAKEFLTSVTGEQCVEFVSMQVPDDWVIKTPLGSRFIRELHAHIVTAPN